MAFKKIISSITGLLFLMSAAATASGIHLIPDEPTEQTNSIHTGGLHPNSIFLAENESEASKSDSQSTNESRDQASSSEAVDREKSGSKSNNAETKPIKPFKPSEEIAAEQAVDFPVDI